VPAPVPAPIIVAPAPVYPPAYRPHHGYRKVHPRYEYPRVIPYTHGRYELRGDAYHGYRWVWIPNGRFAAPSVPPLPPPPYAR
jgi:hypothetical protein